MSEYDCHEPDCDVDFQKIGAKLERLRREDPGCQAVGRGPFRRLSNDAVLTSFVYDLCPACYDAGCEKKREIMLYEHGHRGGTLSGNFLVPCAACGRKSHSGLIFLCKCCQEWFFACDACQERARGQEIVVTGPSWFRVLAPEWLDRLWRRLTGGRRG